MGSSYEVIRHDSNTVNCADQLWYTCVIFLADDVVLADLERVPSLPVIGDRYSNILHDIPVRCPYTISSLKMV